MILVMANDHASVELKQHIKEELEKQAHTVIDLGAGAGEEADYPDQARKAAEVLLAGEADRALLFCGTGIGISIAANKIKGVRCCVCSEPYSAAMSRRHNDANALAIGARVVGNELALCIVNAFLQNEFEGERHAVRVAKIESGE
jgi:ribose 5-phosphate isomerase B